MGDDYRFKLTFWGVRGSTPTPRIENLTFGGNTSCVEVRTGDAGILVFDAGTGITPSDHACQRTATARWT